MLGPKSLARQLEGSLADQAQPRPEGASPAVKPTPSRSNSTDSIVSSVGMQSGASQTPAELASSAMSEMRARLRKGRAASTDPSASRSASPRLGMEEQAAGTQGVEVPATRTEGLESTVGLEGTLPGLAGKPLEQDPSQATSAAVEIAEDPIKLPAAISLASNPAPTPTPLSDDSSSPVAIIAAPAPAPDVEALPIDSPIRSESTSDSTSEATPSNPTSTSALSEAVEVAPHAPSVAASSLAAPSIVPSPLEPSPVVLDAELASPTAVPVLASPKSKKKKGDSASKKDKSARVEEVVLDTTTVQEPIPTAPAVDESVSKVEIARLTAQLDGHQTRLTELQASHALLDKSAAEKLALVKTQLEQKDVTLKLVNDQLLASEAARRAVDAEVLKAAEEYAKLKIVAKEEEEKRIKALSLLRALRQKLVKSEKDKEEGDKEREALRLSEAGATDQIRLDRARYDQEVTLLRTSHDQQRAQLRLANERETTQLRAQYERAAVARKAQFELEAITVKAASAKSLATKDARIQQLETTVRELSTSRDTLFDQLQMRTAEVESVTEHQQRLKAQTDELQYELKETRDQAAALREELEAVHKAGRDVSRDDTNNRRQLAEAEVRHEARIRDLEAHNRQLEKDRIETEEELGRSLQDRLREVERMRQQIVQKDLDYAESVQSRRDRDAKLDESAKRELAANGKVSALELVLVELRKDLETSNAAEAGVREELQDRMQRASELEGRLEEVQSKESTLRSNNKVLRDELRKLQSGVLLSEKQRNPGVGYFSSYSQPGNSSVSLSSPGGSAGGSEDGRASTPGRSKSAAASTAMLPRGSPGSSERGEVDEALNFEYLRNVLLEFLEKPAMRPQLLGVMGVILHFSPADLRRLAAKSL